MSVPFLSQKEIDFSKVTMTITEFLADYLPLTDCNPIGQRPAVHVSPNNAKSVAIIESILYNIDIGNITLVDVRDEPTKYVWESLDGGHRKRAIRDYRDGLFSVFGMTYSQLPDEIRERFNSYVLSFTLYKPLEKFMKGVIFRSLNKTTDVNDQETLNSYGDHPLANAVRETVRVVTLPNGKTSTNHDFFELTRDGNFKWISGSNLRLKQEEYIARVYYSFYNGGKLGPRKADQLEKMYNDDTVNVKKLKKKVDNFLEFLYEMGKARKNQFGSGLGNSEKNTLLNLYLHLSESYGSDLECTDYYQWYLAFSECYNDLYNDPKGVWKDIQNLDFESKESTLSQLFRDYSRNHDSGEKQLQLVKWITSHPNWEKVLEHTLFKDPNRCFPNWMKEVALQLQGYVCAIDGLPLTWADAEAGHIVAHKNGGRTVLDNLAMIRREHNRAMGTMDVREYKKLWDEKVA